MSCNRTEQPNHSVERDALTSNAGRHRQIRDFGFQGQTPEPEEEWEKLMAEVQQLANTLREAKVRK